jgi:hypothetical protein
MGLGIYRVALNGAHKPEPVLQTQASESHGVLSPDNRWLAYVSNDSGRSEVYVRPFVSATGELGADRVTISNDGVPETAETSQPGGGGTARVTWRGDSGALVYRNLASALMLVTLDVAGSKVKAGIPQRLFTIPVGAPWAMTKDGNRFLVAVQTGEAAKVPIHVVSNWESLLKR